MDNLSKEQKKFIKLSEKQREESGCIAYLSIENFGAIKKANIEINKLTLFIGNNNTGKSTLAKLITILMDITVLNKDHFLSELKEFDISRLLAPQTKIYWYGILGCFFLEKGKYFYNIKKELEDLYAPKNIEKSLMLKIHKEGIRIDNILNEFNNIGISKKIQQTLLKGVDIDKVEDILVKNHIRDGYPFETLYIPAEREFITTIAGSTLSLLRSGLPISATVLNFAAKFEQAKYKINTVNVRFFDSYYHWENGEDRIYFSKNRFVPMSLASSGMKSVIPAYITLLNFQERESSFITFEEPENNLYPTTQKEFINELSRLCLDHKKKLQCLTITTHSPYILSSFNNLIQAGTLAASKPELADKIDKIIPKDSWINFKDVSAYSLKSGTAHSILDQEWQAILAEEIDGASDIIGEEYEQLLSLKYGNTDNG